MLIESGFRTDINDMKFWTIAPALTLMIAVSAYVRAEKSEKLDDNACKERREQLLAKVLGGRDLQKNPLLDSEKMRAEAAFKISKEVHDALVKIAHILDRDQWQERFKSARDSKDLTLEDKLFVELITKTRSIAGDFIGAQAKQAPGPSESVPDWIQDESSHLPDPHRFFLKGLLEKTGHHRVFRIERQKPSFFSKFLRYEIELCVSSHCMQIDPTAPPKPHEVTSTYEIWASHPDLPKDLLVISSSDGEKAYLKKSSYPSECLDMRS